MTEGEGQTLCSPHSLFPWALQELTEGTHQYQCIRLIPCGALQGSSGEMFLIDKQPRTFFIPVKDIKKIAQRFFYKNKWLFSIGYREAGQKERAAGYLDVSIMTSKGPSGICAVE